MTYCAGCGHKHETDSFPKTCKSCGKITFSNPIPVTVLAIPVKEGGVVVIKRGIEPQKDGWALPGGFMETGETAEEAVKREVFEETGIEDIQNLRLLLAKTNAAKTNLVLYYTCDPISKDQVKPYSNSEVLEVKVSTNEKLCFPTHQEVFDLVNPKTTETTNSWLQRVSAIMPVLFFAVAIYLWFFHSK